MFLKWIIDYIFFLDISCISSVSYSILENSIDTKFLTELFVFQNPSPINVDNSHEYIDLDNSIYYNHNFYDLPWPASEKMTSLVILYLEVSYTILFIFLVVSYALLEIIITYSTIREHKYLTQEKEEGDDYSVFSSFPIHFTPEEEHFIDMFVILIPTGIVLQLILPTLGYLYNEEFLYYDTYVSFDVKVIGNQWFWTYEYVIDFCNTEHLSEWNKKYSSLEEDPLFLHFDSVMETVNPTFRLLDVDNPLILPVNTNILFSFTSRDVIHSWALPQMGIKVDCIPGRITHTIFSSFSMGVFYGQCSELCGPLHGFMPICVEILSFDHFFIWVLIKHKISLQDSGTYTDLIYTKEVYKLLGLNDEKSITNFFQKLKLS